MRIKLLTIFTALLLVYGCIPRPGVYHTIKPGENLWRICYNYGADLQETAEINNIPDPTRIRAGERIFIPRGINPRRAEQRSRTRPTKSYAPRKVEVDHGRFSWPVSGDVTSGFGMRDGKRHDGIDISAPRGSDVRAAADGRVEYVDEDMRGYGRIIILKHEDDFYTVYAHNRENHVKRGERIKAGDVIALVGGTGNASGPHLHFEVRKGRTVRNPLFFLPK